MKIGFIGCGNLAISVIEGFINQKAADCKDIGFFSNDNEAVKKSICEKYCIISYSSNADVIKNSDLIILAIKPNIVFNILDEIKNLSLKDKIILSVAAGVSVNDIKQKLSYDKVIRMMPNILGSVGEGMFVIAQDESLKAETEILRNLFGKIGKVMIIDEQYLKAVTAISGSAPAYVFMFIEALANGGIREGLPSAISYEIASQAVLGSAKLALCSNLHPAALREKVCSPAGTTIEAVASLENDGFKASIMNAVKKCANKS